MPSKCLILIIPQFYSNVKFFLTLARALRFLTQSLKAWAFQTMPVKRIRETPHQYNLDEV